MARKLDGVNPFGLWHGRILRPDQVFERKEQLAGQSAARRELEPTKKGRTLLGIIWTRHGRRSESANAKASGVSRATYYRTLADPRFAENETLLRLPDPGKVWSEAGDNSTELWADLSLDGLENGQDSGATS